MEQPATQITYRMPPPEIAALVDAPPTPSVSLDPRRAWMLVMSQPSLPPISELARPELRLAGLRLDPGTNGPSRASYYTALTLKRISDGLERPVTGLPEGAKVGQPRWAPDGAHIAFTVTDGDGITLWAAGVEAGASRRLSEVRVNAAFGVPFAWLPDGRGLVFRAVPEGRRKPPRAPAVPEGPVIQENEGNRAPSRTYQDLLKNAFDEALFEFYGTSQVAVAALSGEVQAVGPAGIVRYIDPSPDGEYLLVETVRRPFSYLVPYYRFPLRVEVWDRAGRVAKALADLPLAESVPIAFDGVPAGPRLFGWRADAPATVCWTEAQDGGDPAVEARVRDRLFTLSAPFEGAPAPLIDLALRFAGVTWGRGDLALVTERWWKTRRVRTWRLAPDVPEPEPGVLFDRSWEDRYGDPGAPLVEPNGSGRPVLLTDGGRSLFLAGSGASPGGISPFWTGSTWRPEKRSGSGSARRPAMSGRLRS